MWTECWMYIAPRVSGRSIPLPPAGGPYERGPNVLLPGPAPAQRADRRPQRVEVKVVHPLLERDDGVVGDVDVLGAHLLAAFGDVAEAGAGIALEQRPAVEHVARMHLQAGDPDHEARTVVLLLPIMVAQHVAHVLAKEALDAFAKLEHPIDVL